MLDFEKVYNYIIISEGYKEVKNRIIPLLPSISPKDISDTLNKHRKEKDRIPEEYRNIDAYFSKKFDKDIVNRFNKLRTEINSIPTITKNEAKKNLYNSLKLTENDEYILFKVPTHEDAVKLVRPGKAVPAGCDWPPEIPVTWCIAADTKESKLTWYNYIDQNNFKFAKADSKGVYILPNCNESNNFYFAFRKHPINDKIGSRNNFLAIQAYATGKFAYTYSPNVYPSIAGWPISVPTTWQTYCKAPDINETKFVNYNDITPVDWKNILSEHPQLAKYCNKWDEIDLDGWVYLLRTQPHLIQFFNKRDNLDVYQWYNIIRDQPQLIKYCDKIDKFGPEEWVGLLEVRPELADKCDKWDKFLPSYWYELLINQPQFAKYCNTWNKFDGREWGVLLSHMPQFAPYCDKHGGWEKINERNEWGNLLANQPQFADKCSEFDGWKQFDGWTWVYIISKYPKIFKYCDEYEGWRKLDEFDWCKLLKKYPQFANKCTQYNGWKKFSMYEWKEILEKHPRFNDIFQEYKYKVNK